jgi:hypothetical protein
MSNIRIFAMLIFIVLPDLGFGKILDNQDISVGKISDSEIFVQKSDSQHRCKIDQKLINVKLSSDEKAVIISGTSYIPVAELMQCNPVRMIHAKMAAPHVGFLSDINLRAGLYASLLPVAVNPLSFVAIVAQIGSDRNLVTSPGFYRKKLVFLNCYQKHLLIYLRLFLSMLVMSRCNCTVVNLTNPSMSLRYAQTSVFNSIAHRAINYLTMDSLGVQRLKNR